MTSETKNRIAAINSGIIPEGYKKTKVGIVPVEWEVDHIGKHLQEYREISNDIEKYPVYSSSRKGLIPQSDYYDQKEATQTNLGYKIVPVGYVTYRHMSDDDIFHFNFNTTGQSVLVSSEYPVFNAKSNANLYYIISCLNEMPRFRYFCRSQKLGGTRTRLYYKNLSMYQLSFPPLPEQQKIAEILSTQDKLIELKQNLIYHKKQQKKWLMQNLLTGKIRLKGFDGEWKKFIMKQVLTEHGEKNTNQKYRICSVAVRKGVVDQIKHLGRSYAAKDTSNYNVAHYGDIIYTKSPTGDFPYGIIKQNHLNETVAVSPLYGVFSPINFAIGYIIHTYFEFSINANNYLYPIVQKGAKNTININNEAFLSRMVYLPVDEKEQTALAEILSQQDKGIELLEQELDLQKQKKKALMQLLLTGKVRCI